MVFMYYHVPTMRMLRNLSLFALAMLFAALPLLLSTPADAQSYPPRPPTTTQEAPLTYPGPFDGIADELRANSANAGGLFSSPGQNATAADADGGVPAGGTGGGAALAFTGSDFSAELAVSALMIGVGGAFVLAGRRHQDATVA